MKEKRLINIVSEVYKRSAVFNGEFIAVEKTQKKILRSAYTGTTIYN